MPFKERFNLYVLTQKEKRLIAELRHLEKRLEAKKIQLSQLQWEKVGQEYKLNKLINS